VSKTKYKLNLKDTSDQFKLDIQDIIITLKEMIHEGTQHGIIDQEKGIFNHYSEEHYEELLKYYFKKKRFIQEVADGLNISYAATISWVKDLITSGKLQGFLNEDEGYYIPYDEILDSERKIQFTADQITDKIITLFDISQSLILVSESCKQRIQIREIISQLHHVLINLEKMFPDFKHYQNISTWYKDLYEYDHDSYILGQLANNLEYDVIQWLKDIEGIATDNIKTYLKAFEATAQQTESIQKELESTKSKIDEIETNYSARIADVLLILHKESGLCIFNYKFGSGELDPDLLSGFLTAIQSFGHELTSYDEAAMSRLSYRDFEIYIDENDLIRVALIGKGKISEYLEGTLSNFINDFSKDYNQFLVNFAGNIKNFSTADSIVKRTFNISDEPELIEDED
jgi:hypothetical protein